MTRAVDLVFAALLGGSWLAGIVMAKGFLSTVAAIWIPPYAWYLVVERIMAAAGWAGA